MKKIRFKKIKLLNFCGIREKEIEFSEEGLTTISASNGKGKSTIYRAISYALFGSDENGNFFDIKTFDKDRNIIKEIPHEVSLVLSVDDEEVTFKRKLTDSWEGDKCTNTYKYFIDGELTTAGDYKKAIDGIFAEKPFRYCSSPTAFTSEPWDVQRSLLEDIAGGDATVEEVTNGEERYDFIVKALKKESIKSLMHHLKYSKSEVQKQLDSIPVRLEELNKALPEAEDWVALSTAMSEKQASLLEVSKKIESIKTGGAAQVRNEGICKQIEFQRKRIYEMEKGARTISGDEEVKHGSDLINAKTAKSKAESIVKELKAKNKGFTETELHLKEQIDELCEKNKKGAKQYEEVSSETWQWDDKNSFCPYCGQPLPLDRLRQIKQESEARFNSDKAQRLKVLVALAGDIKKEKEQCGKLLEQLNEDRMNTINQLTEAHKALKDAENHLSDVEKENPRSASEILESNANYKQAKDEIARLEEELNRPVEDDEERQKLLADLGKKGKSLSEEIESLRSRLSKKDSYDRVTSLIDECKKNKETYQNQIDELDEKLDIASDYNQKSCQILEDKVNQHFSFVKFCLFKSDLYGEKKPFCECYHDGVPYSRLNGAAKINAGIDIANTISKFYDVSVPMVLDECESNLHPIFKDGQQIRFYVTNDEELKVDYPPRAVME